MSAPCSRAASSTKAAFSTSPSIACACRTGARPISRIVRHDGSVVLVPMDDDGRVLLVRRYRHAAGRFLWELPAGSLEVGEDPDEAARRECQEELGLIPGRLERLLTLYPTPGFCTEVMTFYRATELRRRAPAMPRPTRTRTSRSKSGGSRSRRRRDDRVAATSRTSKRSAG